ncbi:hypothetical protein SASPL_136510 [Salvia splendens]|uniref:DUF4408 domain-containing protein n=1 Tax=Salvia splendens TaxID=180675 RepID=A0A8X8ZHL3_SALSN|nr:uncharacterized protein LOC121760215 [Salvia splendens]KAG6404264.1 hypothetical protein SASPL_136510 [Salvia splendens]
MAFLFVDSLAKNNSRFVQISCKILELLFLSMGLVSTILFLKDALNLPQYCKTIFSTATEFWSSIKCFFSSSPTTITAVTINLMILLIFASSRRRHHLETTTSNYILGHVDTDLEFQIDHDHDFDLDQDQDHDHDQSPLILEPPPLPQPSAPPIWDVIEVTPLLLLPSDVAQPILIRDSNATNWYDDDVSNQDSSVGLQTHLISNVQSTVLTSSTAVATIEKWKDALIIEKEAEEREATDQEEDNTMDATWEAITGGGKPKQKLKPKLKQKKKLGLKKSETWEEAVSQRRRQPRRLDSEEVVPTSPKWRELRKAETFNDAVSATRRGGLVRRDPSMSLEEFNLKVDRFIKNFNDEIRLQRQESYQRYLRIINQRG